VRTYQEQSVPNAVIPAKAGIPLLLLLLLLCTAADRKKKLDSRFRGNDGGGD
jgi:hypothetical protein